MRFTITGSNLRHCSLSIINLLKSLIRAPRGPQGALKPQCVEALKTSISQIVRTFWRMSWKGNWHSQMFCSSRSLSDLSVFCVPDS